MEGDYQPVIYYHTILVPSTDYQKHLFYWMQQSSPTTTDGTTAITDEQQCQNSPPSHLNSESHMSKKKRHLENNDSLSQEHTQKRAKTIDYLLDELDYLFYEWNTISIVLESVQNAFTVKKEQEITEEYLDQVDKELSFSYDDLISQVRQLERGLKRLSKETTQRLKNEEGTPPLTPCPTK